MSLLKVKLSILLGSLGLASCSPEDFEVRPCLQDNHLGFELGTLSAWFGLARAYPRVNNILVAAMDDLNEIGGFKAVWETRAGSIDLATPKRRGFIHYGERFPDMETKTQARPLRDGAEYRVIMSYGGHDGMADFSFNNNLPVCRRS